MECISVLQACLEDLEDSQVELLLLRSFLGVCKLNYLLRTIPLVVWTLSY